MNEWESIYDYLLCAKFGFEWEWGGGNDAEGVGRGEEGESGGFRKKRSKPAFRRWRCDSTTSVERTCVVDDSGPTRLALSPNDFPYYFESGIEHWVLWKLGRSITANEIVGAKMNILRCHQGNADACLSRDESKGERGTSVTSDGESLPTPINCNHVEFTNNGHDSRTKIGSTIQSLSVEAIVNDHSFFLHWVNPPHLKSLPGIDHVHILFHKEALSHLTGDFERYDSKDYFYGS